MDLGQLYMASPDWIKGLMVVLPFLTFYGTARLFAPRPTATPLASGPVPQDTASLITPIHRLPRTPLEICEGLEAAEAAPIPVRPLDLER